MQGLVYFSPFSLASRKILIIWKTTRMPDATKRVYIRPLGASRISGIGWLASKAPAAAPASQLGLVWRTSNAEFSLASSLPLRTSCYFIQESFVASSFATRAHQALMFPCSLICIHTVIHVFFQCDDQNYSVLSRNYSPTFFLFNINIFLYYIRFDLLFLFFIINIVKFYYFIIIGCEIFIESK